MKEINPLCQPLKQGSTGASGAPAAPPNPAPGRVKGGGGGDEREGVSRRSDWPRPEAGPAPELAPPREWPRPGNGPAPTCAAPVPRAGLTPFPFSRRSLEGAPGDLLWNSGGED